MSVATLNDTIAANEPPMTGDEAALLAWAATHPGPRAPAPMSGNGRYQLPDPNTGKARTWTRATTLAGTIDDTYHLQAWSKRRLALGLIEHPELARELAALNDPDGTDKQAFAAIAARAEHLAGAQLGANLGTALHTATEHLHLGGPDTLTDLPASTKADIAAYQACIDLHQLGIAADHVERIVVCPDVDAAGKFDLLATGPWGPQLRIVDLKTQKSLDFGARKIAAQLAIYANATHMWRPDGTGWEPVPDIDRHIGLVIHLPVGTGTATLHQVDLDTGWDTARLCHQVRAARRGENKLIRPADPVRVGDITADLELTLRNRWITARLETLAASTAARQLVGEGWAHLDIPTRPPWTNPQIDQLHQLLTTVETRVEAPYPPSDPAADNAPARPLDKAPVRQHPDRPTPDEGPAADPDQVQALIARGHQLATATDDQSKRAVGRIRDWNLQARRNNQRFGDANPWTQRCLDVNQAALALAYDLDEPDPDDHRDVIAACWQHALSEPWEPTWLPGLCLAQLTALEAQQITTVAAAFAAGDPQVSAALVEIITGSTNPTNHQQKEPASCSISSTTPPPGSADNG